MFNLNNYNYRFFKITKTINNIFHFITLGRMSSGIIHDLVNPLTALLLNLNTIEQKPEIKESSQNLCDFIEIIKKQIKNDSNKERFSVSKTIEESMILMKYKALNNNVRLISIDNGDVILFGNKNILIRVIINLISNAIDSYEKCPKEQQDVVISLFKNKNHVCISTKDNGCGISRENKNKIFKYFYTNKESGTGIGLSSSLSLIKKEFKGDIQLKSELNLGSDFTIKIPIKSSHLAQHLQKNCPHHKH